VPDAPPTEAIVCGRPGAAHELAVVIKRTFDLLPSGATELADEQLPLVNDGVDYDPLEPPRVSPPAWDSDLLAFKPLTDVVVQGHVYSYGELPSADAELHVGELRRVVRAYGERRLERRGGGFRLSGAEPFSKLPLRYDRAYGGYDARAHALHGDAIVDAMALVGPEPMIATCTRYHYPRNSAGVGFIAHAELDDPESVAVPNFEFPFDPISADRLFCASPYRWLEAPLPAGFDWYAPDWFPRAAYLGLTPDFTPPAKTPLEVERGWLDAARVDCTRTLELRMDPRFQQGSSPGLAFSELPGGTRLLLRHLFPGERERQVVLPRLTPQVEIVWGQRELRTAATRLLSVVVRPDDAKLVMVWSARAPSPRPFHPSELAQFEWRVSWA
jgi:hypothetical protein